MLIRFILFFLLLFFVFPKSAFAIDNPLSKPNNKIGMHIFFPSEIFDSAKLINSNGGDWGYVTIPIQSTDRDLKKWQNFMYACKKFHIIPILRLATGNDPVNTAVWKKPELTDVIDIANFLNQLSWPTQNRYVVIFNEVNRADEWGGTVSPSEYANILSFAVTVFKSKSPDFFVISSGLDNAAPNQNTQYMNQYEFMRQMNTAVPAIFNQIDGISSHSYPNPAFSQAPNVNSKMGVASFKHERDLARELTGKTLPVFITETGWSGELVSDELKTKYYQETFNTIWNDPGIVAVTPFIFEARNGPFEKFSFRTSSGSATKQYEDFEDMTKVKGEPALPLKVLAAETTKQEANQEPDAAKKETGFSLSNMMQDLLKLLSS
jgi:hypothetical protein